MKKFAIAALVLVVAIAAALFWLRGNLDGLVRDAVAQYGSAMTGATVSVDAVKIAPADGKGEITGLTVGNPAGFKTAHAMKVARVAVDIDIASVASDVVHIRRIAVAAPDVIYEKGEAMTNFDAIQKNIAAYLGPDDGKSKSGKKLIVDEFSLTGAQAHASAAFMGGKTVALPLPDILLKDIGKAEGGVTPAEFGQIIAGAMKSKLTGAYHFDKAVKATGEALGKAGDAIKGLFK